MHCKRIFTCQCKFFRGERERERERVRERERERDRQTDRQTNRQTDRQTDRQRQRQTQTDTDRQRQRDNQNSDRQWQTDGRAETGRQRASELESFFVDFRPAARPSDTHEEPLDSCSFLARTGILCHQSRPLTFSLGTQQDARL